MKNLEHFKRFNDVIQSVLEPGNPEYRSLAGFVGRLLIQFKLRGSYDVAEIINIAYCCGVDAIDAGKEIYNSVTWLKRTCLHVIHELYRNNKKVQSLDEEGAPKLSIDDAALTEKMMQVDLKTIHLALNELSPSDCKLLRMRVIEGSSWREISHELALVTGGEPDKEGTLRKRGYRSLLRLREIYDDIRPEQKSGLDEESEYQVQALTLTVKEMEFSSIPSEEIDTEKWKVIILEQNEENFSYCRGIEEVVLNGISGFLEPLIAECIRDEGIGDILELHQSMKLKEKPAYFRLVITISRLVSLTSGALHMTVTDFLKENKRLRNYLLFLP